MPPVDFTFYGVLRPMTNIRGMNAGSTCATVDGVYSDWLLRYVEKRRR